MLLLCQRRTCASGASPHKISCMHMHSVCSGSCRPRPGKLPEICLWLTQIKLWPAFYHVTYGLSKICLVAYTKGLPKNPSTATANICFSFIISYIILLQIHRFMQVSWVHCYCNTLCWWGWAGRGIVSKLGLFGGVATCRQLSVMCNAKCGSCRCSAVPVHSGNDCTWSDDTNDVTEEAVCRLVQLSVCCQRWHLSCKTC
jgi:hypothetical protein